jgi:hypothetical protein
MGTTRSLLRTEDPEAARRRKLLEDERRWRTRRRHLTDRDDLAGQIVHPLRRDENVRRDGVLSEPPLRLFPYHRNGAMSVPLRSDLVGCLLRNACARHAVESDTRLPMVCENVSPGTLQKAERQQQRALARASERSVPLARRLDCRAESQSDPFAGPPSPSKRALAAGRSIGHGGCAHSPPDLHGPCRARSNRLRISTTSFAPKSWSRRSFAVPAENTGDACCQSNAMHDTLS